MLRYKKHKRHVDGLGTSGVGVMDDTDREVSSFTDRAFRSLCVAEEEPYNDVPHIPSPIKGMPLSTKCHLGIFNLSVRKTQPLAQLPAFPGQRGKWAPTFQPLLNCGREGMINSKTNINKLCAPEPRGYSQSSSSKVSSLIKTFDNTENERPDGSHVQSMLPLQKCFQKEIFNTEEDFTCDTNKKNVMTNDLIRPTNPGDNIFQENPKLHRRTARDVFLETQADKGSKHSGSPCPGITKKLGKEPTRKTHFLHSENSAFKSWSDLHKRINVGDESDNSIPGTPPVLGSITPSSPLLIRMIPGIRTREGVVDIGWVSPASTASSSYDPAQMLRSVPPLPSKRTGKQSKEYKNRSGVLRSLDTRIQEEGMQIDVGSPSSNEHFTNTTITNEVIKSNSPLESIHDAITSKSTKEENDEKHLQIKSIKQNVEVVEKEMSSKLATRSNMVNVSNGIELSEKIPTPGRIKNIIQQIEKDTGNKTIGSPNLSLQKHKFNYAQKQEESEHSVALIVSPNNEPSLEVCPNSNLPSQTVTLVPPWRRRKNTQKLESEKTVLVATEAQLDAPLTESHETMCVNKENLPQDKPTGSSFNITNLLTPVIRRKNIQEALDELPMLVTPPTGEVIIIKEQNSRETNLYQTRDDYKSKATGLLFNLKDMRKRVKSTYNPATPVRNWRDNIPSMDVRIQEDTNVSIPVVDNSTLQTQKENTTFAPSVPNSRLIKSKSKVDLNGNVADNYLSLSSPQQAKDISPAENAETIPDEIQKNENIPEDKIRPTKIIDPQQNIINSKDDKSLNFCPNKDTVLDVNIFAEKDSNKIAFVQSLEQPILIPEIFSGTLNTTDNVSKAMELPDVHGNTECVKDSHPIKQLESHNERDEKDKAEESKNGTKDDLQYYAVHCCISEGRSQSVGFGNEPAKRVEEAAVMESEKQPEEKACDKEYQRPASITLFKPNLFCIKDNKIKSSPVTKSVRLPLLRSFSEDSLAFRNGDLLINSEDRRELRETAKMISNLKKLNQGISFDDIDKRDRGSKGKIRELVGMRPASETPKQKCFEHNENNFIKMKREEEESLELWKQICSLDAAECRKNKTGKTEISKFEDSGFNMLSPKLKGPFFHPVETCVSEVTGPSPQYNTLLIEDASDSIKDMMNGEVVGSSIIQENSIAPSPVDSSLQFEDAVAFSEDIACSTITSPMSDSMICSKVASPMSVNTQSSGFNTAPSVLEDLTSSNSAGVNIKNETLTLPIHDKPVSTLERVVEMQTIDKHVREKATSVESQKMNSAKPPAVPPKTEKALRRAKRLTKKRRKTELPLKMHEVEFNESEVVLDVPSPGNVTPTLMSQPDHVKLVTSVPTFLQQEESISLSSMPTFPVSQRKLLQDPESGQYFVVDLPVHFQIKTFYDPETGKYVQVSLPPSEMENPHLEVLNSPYMLYPRIPQVPVSSISILKENSQIIPHVGLERQDLGDCWEERLEEDDYLKGQKYIEPACASRDESMAGTPYSMDRIQSRSRSPDIISIKDLDEFATEAVS